MILVVTKCDICIMSCSKIKRTITNKFFFCIFIVNIQIKRDINIYDVNIGTVASCKSLKYMNISYTI